MTSVILLFSLLTPNLEDFGTELLMSEVSEPPSDAIERMLAKFEREYQLEQAIETANSVFGD